MPRAHIEIIFHRNVSDEEVEKVNDFFISLFHNRHFYDLDWRDDRTLWIHLNIPLSIAYVPVKEVSGD